MRRIIVAVMALAVAFLSSCTNRIEQNNAVVQGGEVQLSETDKSVIIRTEDRFTSLLESIGAGETAKSVTLVGKLDLGSNPKWDPSKLMIGKTSVYFGHYLGKDKYSNQTVLVKADIRLSHDQEDAQVPGYMILNVQHVEIVEQP